MVFSRDEHPEKILTSMETIMTLVLEESEDVSLELLTPILESLKRNDEVRYYLMYVLFFGKVCKLSTEPLEQFAP